MKFATSLQLLRRSLSQAHTALGECESETDFISIVVIAETALATKKWNEQPVEVFKIIRDAAIACSTKDHITYDDFNQVFRLLNAAELASPVPALGEILKKPIELIPSLKALRQTRSAAPEG